MSAGRQDHHLGLSRAITLLLPPILGVLIGLAVANTVSAPRGAEHSCPAQASRDACSYPPDQTRWLALWVVAGFIIGLLATCVILRARFNRRARRQEVQTRVAGVQRLLDQLSGRLAEHWVETATELLRNDEPNEALLQLAWAIDADRVEVSAQTLSLIAETVDDPRDLPGRGIAARRD